MGIRIQPRDIEVPPDDPFKYDLLDRKKNIEVLTHLVGSFEGPCVLAVDAKWGKGKTTFIKMWAQYLRKKEFLVVEFNAWETDFSGNPFATLSTELMEGLQKISDESMKKKVIKVKKYANEIIRQAIPDAIRIIAASTPGIGSIGEALASYTEEKLSAYEETKESTEKFRDVLEDIADKLSETKDGRPLIVVIDELDRCRPSYAVELLEVAKHLFTMDHIVFVLAVNRSELEHSIEALYGSKFDAQGYLRRFFDLDFRLPDPGRRLPDPGRDAFINEMLSAIQIDDYFKRTEDGEVHNDIKTIRKWLQHFLGAHDISLRTIAQSIYRLGLVFDSLGSDQRSFMRAAVVALILRTIDANLYHRFVRGEISDIDVVKKVFDRPEVGSIQLDHESYPYEATFEVMVIMAARELSNSRGSPLYDKYQSMVKDEATDEAGLKHAKFIIKLIKGFEYSIYTGSREIGFKKSAERLELLSSDLLSRK